MGDLLTAERITGFLRMIVEDRFDPPCRSERSGLTETEEELLDALEAVARERREMVAGIHARETVERILRHDLRNPIDGIRTAADYLLQERLDSRAEEFVRLMLDAATRARDRIDNSLAYVQMERGEYFVNRERVNVVQLIREVVIGLSGSRRAYGVDVVSLYHGGSIDGVFDVELWGENAFLADAISNLVRNGIESCPHGGTVTINVDDRIITDEGIPSVRISIHNPVDVPEPIRATVFDPYVTSGKDTGTGLGAYTARMVARAHGGDISMRTGEGAGTEMEMILPRCRPGEPC